MTSFSIQVNLEVFDIDVHLHVPQPPSLSLADVLLRELQAVFDVFRSEYGLLAKLPPTNPASAKSILDGPDTGLRGAEAHAQAQRAFP